MQKILNLNFMNEREYEAPDQTPSYYQTSPSLGGPAHLDIQAATFRDLEKPWSPAASRLEDDATKSMREAIKAASRQAD